MNRDNVSYVGIFLPHIDGNLDKDIPNQHVTLAFKPDAEKFDVLLQHLGKGVEVEVIGYGNDGKNEGLLVNIPDTIPYFGAEQKHITLSIDPKSSAVKTGFIPFDKPIPEDIASQLPDTLVGRIAVFTQDRTLVYDSNEFDEFNRFESEIADDVLGDDASVSHTPDNEETTRNSIENQEKNTDDISL